MIEFDHIIVDSENHGYRIGEQNLISATTLVSKLKPEFDKETISKRVAERDGISQAEVLRQWEKKGEAGRDRGTRLHNYIEDLIQGKIDPITRAINDRIPAMDAFDKVWEKMRSKMEAVIAHQECVVGDAQYGVAGRVDAIFSLNIKGNDSLHIFDWKTGKFRTENQYEKLLAPFSDIDNCEINAYSIQLSLYRLILEKHCDMNLGDSYLVHLRDDGEYMIHRAKDFRQRIHEWLENGLPDKYMSDPATEKRTGDLIKLIDSVNHNHIANLSLKTKNLLAKCCSKMLARLENTGDLDVI